MNRLLLPVAIVAFATSTVAEAAVIDDVTVRQQWPWSREIKVEYNLSGVTSPVDVKVTAYDGNAVLPVPKVAITGILEGIAENGRGRFTIDPKIAFGELATTFSDFKVKLTLEDPVLYKIFDLRTKGASVVELTAADIRTGNYGTYEEDYSNILPGKSTGNFFVWTGVTNDVMYKTTHLVMRRIFAKGRSFTMGDADIDGATEHTVYFTNDFYMAVFPITLCQHELIYKIARADSRAVDYTESGMVPKSDIEYTTIRGESFTNGQLGWWPTPGVWTADGFVADYTKSPHRVANQGYVALRNLRYITGDLSTSEFDLPTEAKWEYVCRAGTSTKNYAGDSNDDTVIKIGWYDKNSNGTKHIVGLKAPNQWGLYDMLGNVWEWCLDHKQDIDSDESVVDPVGPENLTKYPQRVRRGGAYVSVLNTVSAGYRTSSQAHVIPTQATGYRVVFDVH